MHRIDGPGATLDNKFTEGNAALAVPATVVTAAIMNDMQEELCNLITAMDIPLVKGTQTQVRSAIIELIRRGGAASPVIQALVNNQAALADVTNFPLVLTTDVVAIEFLYSIYRRTDSGNAKETGRAYITWSPDLAGWEVTKVGVHDDAGVVLTMSPTGEPNEFKLQYQTDNLAGTSYAGTLRVTDIKFVRAA